MAELTVAEEVILLALDEKSGAGKMRLGLDWVVAGAVIVELTLARRIMVGDDDVVTVLDPATTGVKQLDVTLTAISQAGGIKIAKALRRTHKGAPGHTIAGLVERGVLYQRKARLLGLFPVRRHPVKDSTTIIQIRARLTEAVLNGQTPDERTAALIGMVHAGKLYRKALPSGDRKQIQRRMRDIAQDQSISPAVRKAVARTQGAVIAMAASSGSS